MVFIFKKSLRIYRAIYIFLPVNASLHWVNKVICLFVSFPLISSEVDCALIKVDRLAACIASRVVGAVLVVGVKFAQSSQTLLTNKQHGNLG
jgi:hypothetical protein